MKGRSHKTLVGDGALDVPLRKITAVYTTVILCDGMSGRHPLHYFVYYVFNAADPVI